MDRWICKTSHYGKSDGMDFFEIERDRDGGMDGCSIPVQICLSTYAKGEHNLRIDVEQNALDHIIVVVGGNEVLNFDRSK